MKKIYFWEQALLLKGLLDHQALLQNLVEKLLSGEYASTNLEKIQHGEQKIYSARINDKARMIFTNFVKEGQQSLLILDVLENHEYDRCHFLDKQYIKHFFGNLREENISKMALEEEHPFQLDWDQQEFYFQRLHYFQNQWIELNPNQQDALQIHLPALLEGEAGSGKTCVGLCAMSDYLNKHPAQASKVLYLAPLEHLTLEMQNQWQNFHGHPHAEFKTYEQLFTTPSLSHAHLIQWVNRTQAFPESEAHKILQEFSILQRLKSEQEYLNLGERETYFSLEHKTKIWFLFQNFINHFNFQEHYHPWFSPLNTKEAYDFIYLDESQSFTTYQLLQILALAKENAVLMGFDRHQRISASKRDILKFKTWCHHNQIILENIQLHGSFRCPKKVIQLVNHVLSVKYSLAKGRPDRGSILKYNSQKEEQGQIHYFLLSKDKEKFLDYLPNSSRNWAVITPEEFKESAKNLFDTPLIFSPQECLGLGYDIIVLYLMGQQKTLSDISKELPSEINTKYIHGAKVSLDEKYLQTLNEWIIAASRAQQMLMIIEPSPQKTHQIRRFHQYLFQDELIESISTSPIKIETDRNWEGEILRLISTGHKQAANEAYQRFIYPQTHQPIEEWLAAKNPATRPALAEESKKIEGTSKSKSLPPQLPRALRPISPPLHIEDIANVTSKPVMTGSLVYSNYYYHQMLSNLPTLKKDLMTRQIYLKKYLPYFKMSWQEWTLYIKESRRLEKILYILNKYAHIQNIITLNSIDNFFKEDEDYTDFLQYQITLSTPPLICEFNIREHMFRLTTEVFKNPQFIQLSFLNFLVKNEHTTLMATVRSTGIEGLICQATLYYFEKIGDYSKQKSQEHFEFFLAYLELGVGMGLSFCVTELILFLMRTPQLWPFIQANKWSTVRSQNGIFSNFTLDMMNVPVGLDLIKHLLNYQNLSGVDLFSAFLNTNYFIIFSSTLFSDPFLYQLLLESCIEEPKIYQTFKSFFSKKHLLQKLLKYKNSFEGLLILLGTYPDFWNLNTQEHIYLFRNKDKTHQTSLLLKILIDAQKLNEPDFHQKILDLFLSGTPGFHETIGESEWMLPLINLNSNQQESSFTWMLSPLIILIRFQIYHLFLVELITHHPNLLKYLKWLIETNKVPETLIQKNLNETETGQSIYLKLQGTEEKLATFTLFNVQDKLIVQEDKLTFFQPTPKT